MEFIGKAKTEWLEGESRKMILLDDFAFIDNNGVEWLAPRDSVIDGSSIPRFLWTVIGSPFVGLHRRASIIHDVYCVTESAPHKAVHKMYFDACRCDGVSRIKANLMHSGIKLGGPKWEK
jgi:hypothetical protein